MKAANQVFLDPEEAYRAAISGDLKCGIIYCHTVYELGKPWSSYLELLVDGVAISIGVTDKCFECGETYKGWECQGPWEYVKTRCNTDPTYYALFKQSDDARKAEYESREWAKKEYSVQKTKRLGMRTTITYWGLSPAEFKMIFEVDYGDVGMAIVLLIIPGVAEQFEGLLVKDHAKVRASGLGLKFEYFVEVFVADMELILNPKDAIRREQHKEVMAWAERGDGKDDQMKILRLKGKTVEDIEKKKAAVAEGNAKLTAANARVGETAPRVSILGFQTQGAPSLGAHAEAKVLAVAASRAGSQCAPTLPGGGPGSIGAATALVDPKKEREKKTFRSPGKVAHKQTDILFITEGVHE